MKRFYFQFTLFVFVLGTLVTGWNYVAPEAYKLIDIWIAFVVLILATLGVHFYLVKAQKKSASKFMNAFLGATVMKLFLYLILILVYALVKRESAFNFSLGFLSLYLFFSSFEVFSLLRHSQNPAK